MAYTSVADARTKLMDPSKEHESVILYGSDNTLSSTTTFYTDAAKTLIAPAGNYVIPTNYKSYYITLNSNGKMIGSPQELSSSLYDTNWVDDSVYQNEFKVSNTNYAGDGSHGGTEYILNTSSLTLTDNLFTSRPPASGQYKLWSVNGGIKQTANLTNIDLSDMKGYDLQIISGDWQTTGREYQGHPTSEGYSTTTLTQTTAVVHLADDPNRVTITGSLVYTFKPDYFVSSASYDPMSYHKRLPDALPIKDSKGYQKQLFDMIWPNSDLWYKGDTPGSTTRVRRTPTRHKKGQYTRFESVSKRHPADNAVAGDPYNAVGEDKYYYEREYFTNYYDRLIFDGDEWIKSAVARGGNVSFSSVTAEQAFVLMKSLTVDNDTWTNGSALGINYRDINQYHWTTAINSGTAYQNEGPANQILHFFQGTNPFGNSRSRDMDWEVFGGYGTSEELGTSFNACYQNAKTYALANNLIPSGGFIPELGYYGGGPYNSTLFGQTDRGWRYVMNSTSLSNLKTKPIFKDYNDYLIDNTQTWQNTIGNNIFRSITPSFHRFYITDYNHYVEAAWFLYAFMHNYDITKKILVDILGASAAESKRVMAYFWHYTEPIDAADMGFERKGWDKWQNMFIAQYRSEVSPAMMQSVAVWSMAYADGAFLWGFFDAGVEDREAYSWWIGQPYVNDIKILYAFGSLLDRQHGLNDWLYIGYRQVLWNKDIVEANTSWLKPEVYKNGGWLTGQDNQPTTLCYQQAPISAYKLSSDGTEALLIITNPWNNGYTKVSHRLRLPTKSNREFTIDTWGTFTTVVRIRNL